MIGMNAVEMAKLMKAYADAEHLAPPADLKDEIGRAIAGVLKAIEANNQKIEEDVLLILRGMQMVKDPD